MFHSQQQKRNILLTMTYSSGDIRHTVLPQETPENVETASSDNGKKRTLN